MAKLDYEELYILLYNMDKASNMTILSQKMYFSVSKTSKLIKEYERKLKVQLFVKDGDSLLSESGRKLLNEIKEPLEQMKKIVQDENNIIGIDENLIEDKFEKLPDYTYKYMNSKELITHYKMGRFNKIIISMDYENDFEFESKNFIIQKNLYFIRKKGCNSEKIYSNAIGCPIAKKLEKEKIYIDEYLTQSIAICKMVRQGEGGGYTFSVDTLDPEEIDVKKLDDFYITFFMYEKY